MVQDCLHKAQRRAVLYLYAWIVLQIGGKKSLLKSFCTVLRCVVKVPACKSI